MTSVNVSVFVRSELDDGELILAEDFLYFHVLDGGRFIFVVNVNVHFLKIEVVVDIRSRIHVFIITLNWLVLASWWRYQRRWGQQLVGDIWICGSRRSPARRKLRRRGRKLRAIFVIDLIVAPEPHPLIVDLVIRIVMEVIRHGLRRYFVVNVNVGIAGLDRVAHVEDVLSGARP